MKPLPRMFPTDDMQKAYERGATDCAFSPTYYKGAPLIAYVEGWNDSHPFDKRSVIPYWR